MVENVGQELEPSRMARAASGHNQKAEAEAGTSRRDQRAAVEADAIREQQLNQTRSGSSS